MADIRIGSPLLKSVDILGASFLVIKEDLEDEELCGDCDSLNQVIRVDINLSKDARVKSYVHEIMHGIIRTSGLGELVSKEVEEALCVAMEQGYKSFKDVEDI
jgi:hypothetical protein